MILIQSGPLTPADLLPLRDAVLARLRAGHEVYEFTSGKHLARFLDDKLALLRATAPTVLGLTRVLLITPDPLGLAAIVVKARMAPGGRCVILQAPTCWPMLAQLPSLDALIACQPDWNRAAPPKG
jgi:hypothetical protein